MSPLPGIYASQISGHLFAPSGAYDALATITLSADTATVSFVGIPSGYKHLQVRIFGQTNRGTYSYDNAYLRFNSDSATSYSDHALYGTGSSTSAQAGSTRDNLRLGNGFLGTSTGGTFGINIIDILDYANTNTYKTVRVLGGEDANGSGQVGLGSGNWRSTAAISTILFGPDGSSLFKSGSQFALYGVK